MAPMEDTEHIMFQVSKFAPYALCTRHLTKRANRIWHDARATCIFK